MEYLKLHFEIDKYKDFSSEELSLNEFLNDICCSCGDANNFDSGNQEQIIRSLLRNHSDDGASPETDDFFITDQVYDHETSSGKVTFNYEVQYFFGCSDLSPCDSHHETVKFTLNVEERYLLLHFIEYERPSTHEEF